MTITLLAVSLNDHPLSQPITASFDARGGSIGRADYNTMALPDPERHISRLQAEVQASGPGYIIKNMGSANPISVSGRQLASGEMAPLAHDNEIRIGGYLLRVIDESRFEGSGAEIARGRAMVNDNLAVESAARAAGNAPSAAMPPTPPAPLVRPPDAPPHALPQLAPAALGNLVAAALAPAQTSSPKAPSAPAFAPVTTAPATPPMAPRPPAPPPARPAPPAPAYVARAPAAPLAANSNPFADLLGPAASPGPGVQRANAPAADPFADLLAPPAGMSASSGGLGSMAVEPGAVLPDDFDPFGTAPRAPPVADRAASKIDPFADLMPSASNPSIDNLFGLSDARAPADDALARFAGPTPAKAGTAQEGGVSVDPMALFGGSSPAPGPDVVPAAERRDHAHNLKAAFIPPAWRTEPEARPSASTAPTGEPDGGSAIPVDATWLQPRSATPAAGFEPAPLPPSATPADLPIEPIEPRDPAVAGDMAAEPWARAAHAPPHAPPHTPPPAPPEPIHRAPASMAPVAAAAAAAAPLHAAQDQAALWQAFCQGVGSPLQLPRGLDEHAMFALGQLMHAAVAGTLQLVAVRAATKQELRADVTMIQSQANNPLKFTPDPHAALEQLINPPMRGFMAGPAAMTDVMNDLVGHSIGTMAGMRAALDGVLQRFAPDQLEAKLSSKSMFDSVLPRNRKARLWDLYLQHFAAIREEAHEDFHTLFGKAFLAAYEQQLERLENAPGSQ